MSFQKNIENAAKDVRDTINEARHRTIAEAEQTDRDVAGDQMTAGEKAGSILNQAKHSVQAETDAARRTVRDSV